MNLYSFVGNDGIGNFDILGLIEIVFESEFEGGMRDIWKVMKAKRIFKNDPNVADPNDGGGTKQTANAIMRVDPDPDTNCWVVRGTLKHEVYMMYININTNRNPDSYDYWRVVGHEISHIMAFVKATKEIAKSVEAENGYFIKKEDAEAKAKEVGERLQDSIYEAWRKEKTHAPSGYGTPGDRIPVPFPDHPVPGDADY